MDDSDFYAALIHELKNNLGLLSLTIDRIPPSGDPAQDAPVDAARLLCEGVIDRLQQALLIYRADRETLHSNIDAYSPHDLVNEIRDRARALAHGRLEVAAAVAGNVPAIWFFDRDLTEMALINAIHNSLAYARSTIRIEAGLEEGFLALTVRDDSDGYPDRILAGLAGDAPYRARGTGLGLQFARLIARSHGDRGRTGELRLFNDGGAVFSLLLP
jgi:signal transduction histidine kinase